MKIRGDRCTTKEKPNYNSRRWAQSRMNRCAKLGPAQHQLFKNHRRHVTALGHRQ